MKDILDAFLIIVGVLAIIVGTVYGVNDDYTEGTWHLVLGWIMVEIGRMPWSSAR